MKQKLISLFQNHWKYSKRLKVVSILIGIITSVLITLTVFNKYSRRNELLTPKTILNVAAENSSNGEVAGLSTDDLPTSTSKPINAKSTVYPSPTATPASNPANPDNNQLSSDSNQADDDNSSDNPANQTQSNTTTLTPSPTPTIESTPTLIPTPDNTPLEASWVVNVEGNQVSAVVTANKSLKSCRFTLWGGPRIDTSGSPDGNTCSFNGSGGNKLWAVIESIDGEIKELGDKPPCSGQDC